MLSLEIYLSLHCVVAFQTYRQMATLQHRPVDKNSRFLDDVVAPGGRMVADKGVRVVFPSVT